MCSYQYTAHQCTALHCTHIKCTVYTELNCTTTLALTQIRFIKFNPMLRLWVSHTSPGKQGERYFLENVLSSNGILSMGRGGLLKWTSAAAGWVSPPPLRTWGVEYFNAPFSNLVLVKCGFYTSSSSSETREYSNGGSSTYPRSSAVLQLCRSSPGFLTPPCHTTTTWAFTKISLGNANNMKTSSKDITLGNNLLSLASFKNAWAEWRQQFHIRISIQACLAGGKGTHLKVTVKTWRTPSISGCTLLIIITLDCPLNITVLTWTMAMSTNIFIWSQFLFVTD